MSRSRICGRKVIRVQAVPSRNLSGRVRKAHIKSKFKVTIAPTKTERLAAARRLRGLWADKDLSFFDDQYASK